MHGAPRSGLLGGLLPFVALGSGSPWWFSVGWAPMAYAGTLTVTVVTDPGAVPDLPVLVAALQRELDGLVAAAKDSANVDLRP